MTEQRKTKRFDLRLPLELIRAGSQRISKLGETKNLSSGGVLFTSDMDFEIGELIEYLITLPTAVAPITEVRLRCMGKVIRRDPSPKYTGAAVAATVERYEFVRPRD